MLDSIDHIHSRGFIHRDIKPSNFAIGRDDASSRVYLIDFGLAKKHLQQNGIPVPRRSQCDFRGTVTYASLNVHERKDMARRDDLWSFYFCILEFLNVPLPWRYIFKKEEVAEIKRKCMKNPDKHLWAGTQVQEIKQL